LPEQDSWDLETDHPDRLGQVRIVLLASAGEEIDQIACAPVVTHAVKASCADSDKGRICLDTSGSGCKLPHPSTPHEANPAVSIHKIAVVMLCFLTTTENIFQSSSVSPKACRNGL